MELIDQLAERKITAAMERGELSGLPGEGRPLCLDDDREVPETLRMAYRVLKNAGYLPPQLQARREIANVESLIVQAVSDAERAALNKRLTLLLMQLNTMNGRSSLLHEAAYFDKLVRSRGVRE